MRIVTFSSALSILVVLGCSGTSHTLSTDASVDLADAASVDAAGELDAAASPDAYVAPDARPTGSFDSIYESIIVPRCWRCHIDAETFPFRPRLTDVETAYTALLDVPVERSEVRLCVPEGVTVFRVRPFDLDTSLLAMLPTCYIRDSEHDLTPEELAEIRAWIAAGAPREPF